MTIRCNRRRAPLGAVMALLLVALPALAERMERLGGYEVHYSLVPTTMLKADIVGRYGISRGRDRALLNVSLLDGAQPVQAGVSGTVTDLLGVSRALALSEVVEGEAVYYLAEVKHDDQEVLRFRIDIQAPDGTTQTLRFQQKMYWADR